MVYSPAFPSLLYTVVLTVSYWTWAIIEIWLIIRERRDPTFTYQDKGSRNLLIVCLVIAIVVGLFTVPFLLPQFTIDTKGQR